MKPTHPAGDHDCDVLVIGAGPSGSSCAYWLAKAGHDVVLVERKAFPREKTCGDGLTPRSVRQLQDMGLAQELAACHRYDGLRSHGFGRSLELPWPPVPGLPRYGYVVTRKDLDAMVADHAAKAGATLWEHTEAVEPIMEGKALRGARLVAKGEDGRNGQVTARYVVVADGANSRFGWSLGNQRNRSYPQGMALRGYWTSPRHDEPWIDSWLDLKDESGQCHARLRLDFSPGRRARQRRRRLVDHLGEMERRQHHPDAGRLLQFRAQVRGGSTRHVPGPGHRGPAPDGPVRRPRSGPTHLVVGDASGMINPFNGEGIAYGYETGRLAALVLGQALASNDAGELRALRAAPRGRVRPVLPGGPGVRARDQPAPGDAGVHHDRDAEPFPDGVAAAHHVQHAPARRDGTGRSGLQGGRRLGPGQTRPLISPATDKPAH